MPKKATGKSAPAKIDSAQENLATGQLYALKALVLENGPCPIEDWLKEIKDTQTKQRIQSRLDRIERGNLGDCKPVGEGIFRVSDGLRRGLSNLLCSCRDNTDSSFSRWK